MTDRKGKRNQAAAQNNRAAAFLWDSLFSLGGYDIIGKVIFDTEKGIF